MQIVIDIDKDVFERIKSGIPESIDCFKCEEAVLYGTPQPKTGHWIFDEILDRNYYCSECKSMGVDYWDYCPYCGAKMIEPQESEE